MRRNTYTPVPVGKLRLSWISLKPRARHTCEERQADRLLYFAQAPIFCPPFILLLTLRATRAPYRSLAGPPSNCGVSVRADVTHDEYEGIPKRKTFDRPALSCTSTRMHLEGRLSVELRNLISSLVRASRGQGFQWPYGGSQLVLTLYHMYIFCFQICNRLVEMMKSADAGTFPVYYSLKEKSERI